MDEDSHRLSLLKLTRLEGQCRPGLWTAALRMVEQRLLQLLAKSTRLMLPVSHGAGANMHKAEQRSGTAGPGGRGLAPCRFQLLTKHGAEHQGRACMWGQRSRVCGSGTSKEQTGELLQVSLAWPGTHSASLYCRDSAFAVARLADPAAAAKASNQVSLSSLRKHAKPQATVTPGLQHLSETCPSDVPRLQHRQAGSVRCSFGPAAHSVSARSFRYRSPRTT